MSQTTETKINEREAAIDTKIAETHGAWMAARLESKDVLRSLMSSASWNHRTIVRRTNSRANYDTHVYIDGNLVVASFLNLAPYLTQDQIDEANKVAAKVSSAMDAYYAAEAEYEGWSRFFLVPAGHIHRSMSCSTCNNGRSATTFSWLPQLSGLTEADAVAAHGAWLCTTCFPTAPVEYTNADALAKEAKKAARCSGSGEAPVEYHATYRNYGKCSGCDKWETTNDRSGLIRAHKAKEAK